MAKIEEIIERVDRVKPNAFTHEEKLRWIAELDGRIAADIMLMDIVETRLMQYQYPEGLRCEPLVQFPHDGIYDSWLEAKIDYQNGEYDKYANSMEMFNAGWDSFVIWFARTYAPAQGYRRRNGYAEI